MFDWFWHLLRLKSPREMKELEQAFNRDMFRLNMQMARAFAMQITDKAKREELLTKISEREARG